MRQADVDEGTEDGRTAADHAEFVQLRRDERRLEMAGEILRRAAARSSPNVVEWRAGLLPPGVKAESAHEALDSLTLVH